MVGIYEFVGERGKSGDRGRRDVVYCVVDMRRRKGIGGSGWEGGEKGIILGVVLSWLWK